jgi:hypothetical protein
MTASTPLRERALRVAAFGAAVALPFVPYLAYAVTDWDDFRGQARTVEQRSDFGSPGLYFDNLTSEPERYNLGLDFDAELSVSELLERPSARLALLVLGPFALIHAAVQGRRGSRSHLLLALTLAALVLEFALFESTKRFVYWVIAVPFLCVAVADVGRALLAWRPGHAAMRRPALAVGAAVALAMTLEGAAVGLANIADARDAVEYAGVGDRVRDVVPPGSRVVTDNRMWLTLRDMEPRSLLLLFYWTNPEISRENATDVDGAMRRIDAGYLLLSPLTRAILSKLTPRDAESFDRYLREHATLVATVAEPPYGPIEVYLLEP